MYDAPWVRAANDSLWAALRRALRDGGMEDVPEALDRDRDLRAIWHDPHLLLAQTCGYPLLTELAGAVRLVATPLYDVPGCDGPLYRSMVVVRADDAVRDVPGLRGRRCAMNGRDSNSGMNVLRALLAPLAPNGRFFGAVIESGGHLRSMAMVRDGTADVAAIDCVTWGQARRFHPEALDGLRVLAETESTPALPFVTAAATDDATVAALRSALRQALRDGAGAGLCLTGVQVLQREDYEPIMALEQAALAQGYPLLA
jgi:ABC-type phosphate/phosphonate transport system substrate-binding protein